MLHKKTRELRETLQNARKTNDMHGVRIFCFEIHKIFTVNWACGFKKVLGVNTYQSFLQNEVLYRTILRNNFGKCATSKYLIRLVCFGQAV